MVSLRSLVLRIISDKDHGVPQEKRGDQRLSVAEEECKLCAIIVT